MLKQSETREINRSEIKLAPYNPRKKSEKVVNDLIKNFKRVGFLGGLVWNEFTGVLIIGHQRLEALDKINKYTGENDYKIKVEVVYLDDKTEKEQNIFMNSNDAQSEFDFEKLAIIAQEINFDFAGLSLETIELINFESPTQIEDSRTDKKEFVKLSDRLQGEELEQYRKNKRQERTEISNERNSKSLEANYMIIGFEDFEQKAIICEHLKLDMYETKFKAPQVFKDLL